MGGIGVKGRGLAKEAKEGTLAGTNLFFPFASFAAFARHCGTLNSQLSTLNSQLPYGNVPACACAWIKCSSNAACAKAVRRAKRAIMAGAVRVNGQVAAKPSDAVRESDCLELTAEEKFVSRGGHKLEYALDHFQIDVRGLTAIDLGASTGGFTDCLLQRGAAKVYAVDVGQGQLAWKLRNDSRVIVMEKTNARTLTATQFPQTILARWNRGHRLLVHFVAEDFTCGDCIGAALG